MPRLILVRRVSWHSRESLLCHFWSGSHGKISRRKTRIYIVSHPSSTLMPEISNSEKCIQTMRSLPRLSLTCILYIGWATWRQDKTSNPHRCGPLHIFFLFPQGRGGSKWLLSILVDQRKDHFLLLFRTNSKWWGKSQNCLGNKNWFLYKIRWVGNQVQNVTYLNYSGNK